MSEDQTRAILKERAKLLARPIEEERAEEDFIDVVAFDLAHEKYGIDFKWICETYPLKELTPVPCAPSFVSGIINLRSEILPVIDLKKFFNLPEKGLSDLNKVVVVEAAGMRVGLLADAISGAQSVPVVALQTPPPTVTGIHASYLRGITSDHLIVLDLEKILSNEEIVVYEDA